MAEEERSATRGKDGERRFSLELKTRQQVKQLSLLTERGEGEDEVLIEGSLGRIEEAAFIEDVLFEFRGTEGTLKLDLSREELLRLLGKNSRQRRMARSQAGGRLEG